MNKLNIIKTLFEFKIPNINKKCKKNKVLKYLVVEHMVAVWLQILPKKTR